MIWDSSNSPNEKIQDLFDAFHCFIEDNHKGTKEEDVQVRREWQKFKLVVEGSPFQINTLQQYVDKLKNDNAINDIKITKSVQNIRSTSPSKKARKEVSSQELQKITGKLVQCMRENNAFYMK